MKQCRTVVAECGKLRVRLNPVVTLVSAVIIWGLAAWAMAKPQQAKTELSKWTDWVTRTWTWLYIGTQDVWAVFIIVIYFSKYSKLKLGKDDEKPEFSDATYFTMLFAAGIGIGLFYFGVGEPIWHYEPGHYGNRYWGRYNFRKEYNMKKALKMLDKKHDFFIGKHVSAVILPSSVQLIAYCFSDNQRAQDAINLTFFHWGIHGWIVYVLIGLLLGFIAYRHDLPMTMRSCFYPIIGDKIYGSLGDFIDIMSIVCTMFGVCTSLGIGVIQINNNLRRLAYQFTGKANAIEQNIRNQIIIIWSITAIATASVISGLKVGIRRLSEICFCLGMFIMLTVFFYDDTWFCLNVFIQSLGYYMQWFVQLGFHTDAFAQLGKAPDGKEAPNWMDEWTIFYWGWWIAWSPFVGMFIARISRGRTIKEFINYTLTLPVLYCFLWFAIFGGIGIKMEREAALANVTCSSALGGKNATDSFNGLYRLSCRGKNDMWFDVINQYQGIGGFLSVMSMISLVLYFVTSSDSGSLIIDCLSANGDPDPPIAQRIFWALTEGACATALLGAGGEDSLTALQAVSISSGLIYTLILNLMCVALWRALKIEGGDLDPEGPQFATDLLDVFYKPTKAKIIKVIVAIFAPWWPLGKVGAKLFNTSHWPYMILFAVPFYTWAILLLLQIVNPGLAYVAWAILIGFFAYATGLRSNIRARYHINGNMVEDFFAVMLVYPLAAVQMENHMEIAVLMESPELEDGRTRSGSIVMVDGATFEKGSVGNGPDAAHAYYQDKVHEYYNNTTPL